MKHTKYDIAIIGGGLAGLTASIHLKLAGMSICLFEKNSYPKHKVCGEYVSNEVKPYLESLGIDIENNSVEITQFNLSSENGKKMSCDLPLGGFGISRYCLDELLYKRALSLGVKIIQESVRSVLFNDHVFNLKAFNNIEVRATYCLGAFGKRSGLDKFMGRDFSNSRSPWLAVKAHYHNVHAENEVSLHHFEGGYCGLSKVETGLVNACYLVHQKVFDRYKNIEKLQKEILSKNKHLGRFFQEAKMDWEKPITISQIYFGDRKRIVDNVLMVGDAGGMIHPLAGNGMAIAIHTAQIASNVLIEHGLDEVNRPTVEKEYEREWNRYFSKRIQTGRKIQWLFEKGKLSNRLMNLVPYIKGIVPLIIKQTHGKSLKPAKF